MREALEPRLGQIHQAACRLFREKGYPGTSVRDIAQAVGIQGGSLYAHVEGKEDLLWEIVSAAAERFFAAIRPIAEGEMNVLQRLKAAIIAHVEVIAADTDAAAVYTVEWKHLSPTRRAEFTARRDEYERLFRRMLRQAMEERLVSAPDDATAALFVLSSLNWVYAWYKPDGRMTPREVGEMLAGYIFDGIRRRMA